MVEFAGTAEAARDAITFARRGGRVVLGGATGTGVELCQKLRELNPKIPILYYSAYGEEADHQNALKTCGDAYLKKPVCIADIQDSIAELLAKRSP